MHDLVVHDFFAALIFCAAPASWVGVRCDGTLCCTTETPFSRVLVMLYHTRVLLMLYYTPNVGGGSPVLTRVCVHVSRSCLQPQSDFLRSLVHFLDVRLEADVALLGEVCAWMLQRRGPGKHRS